PALAPSGVDARGIEQTEQPTHNPLQVETALCRVVQKPFQLFHAAEPEEVAATGQEDRTTGLSSCVSTTGLSSWESVFKNRIEVQAKTPRIVEDVEIPSGSACTLLSRPSVNLAPRRRQASARNWSGFKLNSRSREPFCPARCGGLWPLFQPNGWPRRSDSSPTSSIGAGGASPPTAGTSGGGSC